MVTQTGDGYYCHTARCRRCPSKIEVRSDEKKGPDGLGAKLRDAGWTALRIGVTHPTVGEMIDFICPECSNKPTDFFDIRDSVFWSARRAVEKLSDARFSVDRLGDLDVIVEFSGASDPNDRAIRFHFVVGENRVHVYPAANFALSRPELETNATITPANAFSVEGEDLDVHQFADRVVNAFAVRMRSRIS